MVIVDFTKAEAIAVDQAITEGIDVQILNYDKAPYNSEARRISRSNIDALQSARYKVAQVGAHL